MPLGLNLTMEIREIEKRSVKTQKTAGVPIFQVTEIEREFFVTHTRLTS